MGIYTLQVRNEKNLLELYRKIETNQRVLERTVHDPYKQKNERKVMVLECTGMRNSVHHHTERKKADRI